MRRIGVLTSDFSLYHDLVRTLRDGRIPFHSLAFGETPDPSVGVVITSWKDSVGGRLPASMPIVAVPVDHDGREDVAAAIAQASRVLEGIEGYSEVVIGIDPGLRPGVAVLADGRLLHTTQVFRVGDVRSLVQGLLRNYPAERAVIRVGHGSPADRDEIIMALWPLRADGARLELVDETGTTPETGAVDLPPDVAAAMAIARTPGQPLVREPRRRISPGRVREVQDESRKASGGRVTLSREQAERVARGETTMQDALREGTRPPTERRRNRPSSR